MDKTHNTELDLESRIIIAREAYLSACSAPERAHFRRTMLELKSREARRHSDHSVLPADRVPVRFQRFNGAYCELLSYQGAARGSEGPVPSAWLVLTQDDRKLLVNKHRLYPLDHDRGSWVDIANVWMPNGMTIAQ